MVTTLTPPLVSAYWVRVSMAGLYYIIGRAVISWLSAVADVAGGAA